MDYFQIVDVNKDQCENTHVYVPDLGAYAVVVYSFKDNKSWRVHHNYFHFDPLHGDYNVAGVNFQWTDGVFGMALGPIKSDGYIKPNPLCSNATVINSSASFLQITISVLPRIVQHERVRGIEQGAAE